MVLRRVGAILGNGYGIQGQNYVAIYQGSDMWVGFHIWYKGYNVLGDLEWVYISGLMSSKSKNQIMNRRIFSRGIEKIWICFSILIWWTLCRKTMRGETKDFIFVILVVWSALIVDEWLVVAWGEKSCFGLAEISSLMFLVFVQGWGAGWFQQKKRCCDHKGAYHNATKLKWKILLQFCPQIPYPFLWIGATPQTTKTNSPNAKKTMNITIISSITYRRSTYFHRGTPSLMFDRTLNATLSNNFF